MTDPTAENADVSELSYPAALSELETILDRLEHDEPDVDRVATDVARAAALVAHCRARITAARSQVDDVVSTLDTAKADTAEDADVS